MYNLSCTSISTQPYTAMTWSGSAWQAGANAIPSVFVNGTVRVHPADINQNVILAYTLQAGEQGYISIANSSFLTPGGSGTNYSIFVDNTQIGSTVSVNAGTTTSFNQGLGYLNAGQTKVDPNHWTVFCRFLASEIPQGLSLVSVTQA